MRLLRNAVQSCCALAMRFDSQDHRAEDFTVTDHIHARNRSSLDAVADDSERLQAAIRTHTATATSADGWITVAVSADGTVHNWRIAGADDHTDRLVASLLELIRQAHTTAQQDIRTELDAIIARDDVQAASTAARDTLARIMAPSPSSSENAGWDDEYEYRGKSRIAAE
ncbi:YbaB/EbfC family nucleoid-associated protein [Nocardia sp. NPDC059240]|uniref:YbaB/EbfC family nucleoid-associated protein n=1 Tax=Nocardia sp. NPDC059240 TaxID=3346786 RepID=UPI003699C29E